MSGGDISCNLYNIAYNYSIEQIRNTEQQGHRVEGTNPNPLITVSESPCNGPKTYKDRLLAKKQYIENNTNSNSNKIQLTKAQIISRISRGYTPLGQPSKSYAYQSKTVTNSNIFNFPIRNNEIIICPPCPGCPNCRSAYFDGSSTFLAYSPPSPSSNHQDSVNYIDFSGIDISFDKFTFSLWIKFNSVDASINIISATTALGGNWIWSNNLRLINSKLQYYVWDNNTPGSAGIINSSTTLDINTWNNIIITQETIPTHQYSAALYLNGNQEGTVAVTFASAQSVDRWQIGGTTARSVPFVSPDISVNVPMKAYLDQFVYYNELMSPSDVLTFYTETLKTDTIPILSSTPSNSIALLYDFNTPNSMSPTQNKANVLTDVNYSISTEQRIPCI